MSRPRHPDKHIEIAIRHAEALGWTVEISNGHAWGHLLCPRHARDGCIISVWSTPRNTQNHARHIQRDVDACAHTDPDSDDEANSEDDDAQEIAGE